MRIGATHTSSQFGHELSQYNYVQSHLGHTDNVRKNAAKTAPLVAACPAAACSLGRTIQRLVSSIQ
jgi:hypothetical protein